MRATWAEQCCHAGGKTGQTRRVCPVLAARLSVPSLKLSEDEVRNRRTKRCAFPVAAAFAQLYSISHAPSLAVPWLMRASRSTVSIAGKVDHAHSKLCPSHFRSRSNDVRRHCGRPLWRGPAWTSRPASYDRCLVRNRPVGTTEGREQPRTTACRRRV